MGYWQGIIIGIQNKPCGEVIYQWACKVPRNYPEAPPLVRHVLAFAEAYSHILLLLLRLGGISIIPFIMLFYIIILLPSYSFPLSFHRRSRLQIRFSTKISLSFVDSRGFVNVSQIPNFKWNPTLNIADVLMAIREAMKDKSSIDASYRLIGQEFFQLPGSGQIASAFN